MSFTTQPPSASMRSITLRRNSVKGTPPSDFARAVFRVFGSAATATRVQVTVPALRPSAPATVKRNSPAAAGRLRQVPGHGGATLLRGGAGASVAATTGGGGA